MAKYYELKSKNIKLSTFIMNNISTYYMGTESVHIFKYSTVYFYVYRQTIKKQHTFFCLFLQCGNFKKVEKDIELYVKI